MFIQELLNLNIGHLPSSKALLSMNDLINAIDFIKYGDPTNNEIIKIFQYYEEA